MIGTILAAGTAATALITAARHVLDLARQAREAGDRFTHSLPEFNRQTNIVSRVYIDGNIAEDPVTPEVVRACQTLYLSWILNALQLQRLVTNSKTVREMLSVVSTEGLMDDHVDLAAAFEADVWGGIDKGGAHAGIGIGGNTAGVHVGPDGVGVTVRDRDGREFDRTFKGREEIEAGSHGVGSKDITPAPDGLVPAGRLLEVTLTNPENQKLSVTMSLLVQMMPYIVPASLATQFVTLNANPSWRQRYMQAKAGEISWGKDFLLQLDLNEQRRKAVRDDKDDVLADFMRTQVSKDTSLFSSLIGNGNANRNIANTVLVLDAETVRRAKQEVGVDLFKESDRKRYFMSTYTMLIAIVDPMHNVVTMMYRGLDSVGTYNFSQFKPKSKQGDVVDLIQAMNMFNQGRVPKF